MSDTPFNFLIYSSIAECDPILWNNLVQENNPFVRHEFFASLEKGKCITAKTGWHPQYFILSKNGQYLSAFFCFLKLDSYGEFIFDWEWARAFEQYQIPYYPKLTTAIPFSPITAPKFLGDPDLFANQLLPKVMDFYKKHEFSSFHLLFTNQLENNIFQKLDFKQRDSFQYHWQNNNYNSFEDFLAVLKKNRRKSIKRERRAVAHLKYKELRGDEIGQEDLDFFYDNYLGTIDKKFSQAYLSYDFFKTLFESLPENTILLQALEPESDQIIANALYLVSDQRLYGRYWGCSKEIEFLHFELCLYRGLEIAIRDKLTVFEAGAQGEHKRLRGFRPIKTKSLHHIKHPQFAEAIYDFIDREKDGIEQLFGQFEEISPYKQT
jgi:predicted N-acyltransferase